MDEGSAQMSMHRTILLAAAGTFACGSAGSPPPPGTTRVAVSSGAGSMGMTELHNEPGSTVHRLPLRPDSVLAALPRVYELLGIEGAGSVPDESLVGARNFRPRRIDGKRLSEYIDCGTGATATPKADGYAVTMTLLSRVMAADESEARLETTLEASARSQAAASDRVSCQSTGVLAKRVAERVTRLLLSGG
jgi:hypothetical protein